jgi:ribosomal protein L32
LASLPYVSIAVGFAFAGGFVGRSKGSSFWVWFMISGIVPVIGLITVIAYRHETEIALRRCPGCGRSRRVHDAICTSCGTELEYPADEEIIEPTPELRVPARL